MSVERETRGSSSLIIDLNRLDNAGHLKKENNLHGPETVRVLKLIRDHVEALPPLPGPGVDLTDEMRRLSHKHESILAHGPRGSGKTTLLLTIREVIAGDGEEAASWLSELGDSSQWRRGVKVLPPLDPTLVEGDEVFLATITANVLREIENSRGRSLGRDDDDEMNEALSGLATGFRVLARSMAREAEKQASYDPFLFSERLLKDAMGGLDLAKRFHRFCVAACRQLGVKALLQPIDDADVSIDQGWAVLETVRRYLSHGRVLPLVLGDLDLFGVVVRDAQWKHLSGLAKVAGDLSRAGEGQSGAILQQLTSQVSDLSDQYMLKLVRPERRVVLPDAAVRLRDAMGKEGVKIRIKTRELPLQDLLSKAGEWLFGRPAEQAEPLTWRLISSNTRELRALLMWLTNIINSESDPNNFDSTLLIRGYLEVFAGVLGARPDAREPLASLQRGDLNAWQGWLAREMDPRPYWRLEQSTAGLGAEAKAANVIQVAATVSLVDRWRRHPGEQLHYFGSVLSPMVAWENQQPDLTATLMPTYWDDRHNQLRKIAQRWRLGHGEPAWLTAGRVTVSLIERRDLSSRSNRLFFAGATRIPPKTSYRKAQTVGRVLLEIKESKVYEHWIGNHPWRVALADRNQQSPSPRTRSKDGEVAESLMPALNRWLNELTKSHPNGAGRDVQLLLNCFRLVPRQYTWRYDLIDPWKGLSVIGDLVREFNVDLPDEKRRDHLRDLLQRVEAQSVTLTVPVNPIAPSAADNDTGQAATLDEIEAIETEDTPFSDDMIEALDQWLQDLEKSRALLSPDAWAELATRFASNLSAIEEELSPVEHSVGADLERWVLSFLHHLLIVESSQNGCVPTKRGQTFDTRGMIRATNRQGQIKGPLATNLDRATLRRLPMFSLMTRCPILLALLSGGWVKRLTEALKDALPGPQKPPWTPMVKLFDVDVDAHTALCALMPRVNAPRTDDKDSKLLPDNLKKLDELARQVIGGDSAPEGNPSEATES